MPDHKRIEERVKCEKCNNESAALIKVLSTKESKEPRGQKREERENWVYLKDVLILAYECQNCGYKFAHSI